MSLTIPQLRLIQVAARQLKLTDADYRSILVNLVGVTSSKELDREGFEALLGFFDYLGFRPMQHGGPDYGDRPGMASFAQLELVRAVWREWSGGADGLNTWLKRSFKVDSLRFLTATDAPKAITALKAMKNRKLRAA